MFNKRAISKVLCGVLTSCMAIPLVPAISLADNPIIQTKYTCDPAPMVYGDEVYLYADHDEDVLVNNFFTMKDYYCYSSKDMVNWTDHGCMMSLDTFSWADNNAWAGQCIERNGKFYYYVPVCKGSWTTTISVGVADSPTGPFESALDAPLASVGSGDIDPTVCIDDDGQAYLYWGNPELRYVLLNDNMLSYDTSGERNGIKSADVTVEGFGERDVVKEDYATRYEEGPWFYKRNDLYYMAYAANGVPEEICYSTSTGPLGPWKYQGTIMKTQGKSFTNHVGIIDFKGRSFMFYHNGALEDGGGYHRSIAIEEFEYGDDGSIPQFDMTDDGVTEPVGNLNPYDRIEAETMAWEKGIETEPCTEEGNNGHPAIDVYDIDNNDYIKVEAVGFGDAGTTKFSANVSCETDVNASIELHLDSVDGETIGTLPVTPTGIKNTYELLSTDVSGVTGVHDLYLVFKGNPTVDGTDLFKFDYWKFDEKFVPTPKPTIVPPATAAPATATPTATPAATTPPIATATPSVTAPVAPVKAPAKANIISAKNNKTRQLKVTFKKSALCKGYQVLCATNSKFTKNKISKTFKGTSCTFKKLRKGRTYYVRARAYNLDNNGKKLFGKYSKQIKVKIKK